MFAVFFLFTVCLFVCLFSELPWPVLPLLLTWTVFLPEVLVFLAVFLLLPSPMAVRLLLPKRILGDRPLQELRGLHSPEELPALQEAVRFRLRSTARQVLEPHENVGSGCSFTQ